MAVVAVNSNGQRVQLPRETPLRDGDHMIALGSQRWTDYLVRDKRGNFVWVW